MRTLGNILWHIPLLGFVNALITCAIGGILCLTVVGAPIGLGLIEFGKFLFAPFSRAMVSKSDLGKTSSKPWNILSLVVRIIYLPFGVIGFIVGVVQAVLLAMTIVGIPVAVVIAKSLSTYFNPVNKKCVPQIVAEELTKRKAIEKHLEA